MRSRKLTTTLAICRRSRLRRERSAGLSTSISSARSSPQSRSWRAVPVSTTTNWLMPNDEWQRALSWSLRTNFKHCLMARQAGSRSNPLGMFNISLRVHSYLAETVTILSPLRRVNNWYRKLLLVYRTLMKILNEMISYTCDERKQIPRLHVRMTKLKFVFEAVVKAIRN
jgi:hypothetical protein